MRVLVFGGAAGFETLVRELDRGGWEVTTIVPVGSTVVLPGRVLIGALGGPAVLARYAIEHCIEVIVDATDPFDVALSADAAETSLGTRLPLVTYDPPAWEVSAMRAGTLSELSDHLRLTYHHTMIDWAEGALDPTAVRQDPDNLYIFRRVPARLPRASLPPRYRLLRQSLGDELQERKILRDNQCDALVLPDTGELALCGLLDAATASGIDIFLIERPRVFPRHAIVTHRLIDTLRAVEL